MALLTTRQPQCRSPQLLALLLTLALTGTLLAPPAAADAQHRLMAVYLFNLAKFTVWPSDSFTSPSAPLNLCVLGDDPFGVALDELSRQSVGGRPLTIKRFPRVAIVSDCHVLFISRSERQRLALILQSLQELPVLTVSDIDDFSIRGGMITLLVQERLLRFGVNPQPAALAGIKISSKLLELAAFVVGRRE